LIKTVHYDVDYETSTNDTIEASPGLAHSTSAATTDGDLHQDPSASESASTTVVEPAFSKKIPAATVAPPTEFHCDGKPGPPVYFNLLREMGFALHSKEGLVNDAYVNQLHAKRKNRVVWGLCSADPSAGMYECFLLANGKNTGELKQKVLDHQTKIDAFRATQNAVDQGADDQN
jgi:hypothetical protein